MDMGKLATALQGFGAGVQGRGAEFLAARQNQQQQLDNSRKQAWAVDNRNILGHLRAGNTDRAVTLLNNRLMDINEMGGNPSTSQFLKTAIEEGDVGGALQLVEALDREFSNAGFIEPMAQPEPLTDMGKLRSDLDNGLITQEQYDAQTTADNRERQGMASAVTKIFENGTTVQSLPNGSVAVKTADNRTLQGQEALDAIKAANDFEVRQGAISGAEAEAQRLAIQRADEAFETTGRIREQLGTLDEAKQAVLDGADTGLLASRFPAFSQATRELRNVQARLGLGVISSATFGALSEGELKLALETALPTQLEGPALVEWIDRRQEAQRKLLGEMENLAIFLGTPGNTVADWIDMQKDIQSSQVSPIETNPQGVPMITTQEQRDQLQPGDIYEFNGQLLRKR